jgi:hypothetical protein
MGHALTEARERGRIHAVGFAAKLIAIGSSRA